MKRLFGILSVVIVLSMLLAACGATPAEEPAVDEPAVVEPAAE